MSSFRKWIRGACYGPRCKVVAPDVPEQAVIIAPTSGELEAAAADIAVASCQVDPIMLCLERCDDLGVQYTAYYHAQNALDGPKCRQWIKSLQRATGSYTGPGWAAELAASTDDLPGFLHALDNGAFSTGSLKDIPPMAIAAKHGALSILDHGLRFRKAFRWDKGVLFCAAHSGNVQAVERALHGGCEPCPLALVIAAECGHLACVRYLHARGVPLWSDIVSWYPNGVPCWTGRRFSNSRPCMPVSGYGVQSLWAVFRYGEVHGAPVPKSFGWVMKERRERAREVLLCFHCAARQSRARGEHARRVMGNVPLDVVYVILVAAELEIEETFRSGMR